MAVASSLLDITPQRITAVPGAPLSFELTAHNETRSIRNLTIELVGMDGATVTTNPTTILVPPEGDATIDVRVDLPFIAVGDTSFGFELTDATTGELFGYGDVALPKSRVMASSMPVGTISDTVPFVNIPPFGMCTSMANPAVASATAAALGVLTPMPCTPVPAGTWLPGAPTVLAGNMPALNETSKLICSFAGTIQFLAPSQFTTQVP